MTLAELYTQLQSTGYSVAYQHFEESNVPSMPFICYAEIASNNFGADNKTYFPIKRAEIQLFTKKKDTEAEGKVETALTDLYWTKECEFHDDELCYRTIYTISL